MTLKRWGLALLLATGALFICTSSSHAGELDNCRTRSNSKATLSVADSDLGTTDPLGDVRDSVQLADLRPIEDFHPETDRWTERNNRIRITLWQGIWAYSGELDITNDYVIGLRINWEVPGFIGIRYDAGLAPFSRLEVVVNSGNNPRSSRHASGYTQAHTLSLAIFNPELSEWGMAFWAGFGGGFFIYNYNEDDILNQSGGALNNDVDISFNETNLASNIFVEMDWRIADIFHIGIGMRAHFLLADHTDDGGQFYDEAVNGVEINNNPVGGRNDGQLDDIAFIGELTFNISILF